MKKLLMIMSIFVITIGLLSGMAYANPFLTCDPHSNTTSYIVVLDNGTEVETPAPLYFDLAGIAEGAHVIQLRAKNVWGISSIVPFEFAKALPLLPTNTRLTNLDRNSLR